MIVVKVSELSAIVKDLEFMGAELVSLSICPSFEFGGRRFLASLGFSVPEPDGILGETDIGDIDGVFSCE